MKNFSKKNISILYYLAAVCFYIASIIGFMNDKGYATVYLCLGSAMLLFGTGSVIKTRKEAEKSEEDANEKDS